MQKILQLGVKDWITGIGVGQHLEGGGIFTTADGVNPFVNPALNSADFGLLQMGAVGVDIGGSDVTTLIIAFMAQSGGVYLYGLANTGAFYRITLSNNVIFAATNGDAVVPIINGFISKAGGTEKLYYINDASGGATYAELGTWDFTTWDNDALTGTTNLQSTAFKPVHYWADADWIGNKYYVAKLNNAASLNFTALTLDQSLTITALEDDDYYLVIGASTETGGTIKGKTKVFFWDGFSPSFNKEWSIPEPDIRTMRRIGNLIYAHCGTALYAFNFATSPTKILDLDSDHSPGNSKHTSRIGDVLLWGGKSINMYGKFNSRMNNVYAVPYLTSVNADAIGAIDAETKPGTIYVSTTVSNNKKLYTISTTTGKAGVSVTSKTHFIDLKDVYNIQGVTIVFGKVLVSGDTFTITLENREGNTQTITPDFTSLGTISRQFYPLSLKADQLQIQFSGEKMIIKDIIIYGEKISEL